MIVKTMIKITTIKAKPFNNTYIGWSTAEDYENHLKVFGQDQEFICGLILARNAGLRSEVAPGPSARRWPSRGSLRSAGQPRRLSLRDHFSTCPT